MSDPERSANIMKTIILAAFIAFACSTNAADLSFRHTFKRPNPNANWMLHKGTKEIYVAKKPAIEASAISHFSVSYSPFRTNMFEWTHQISITFTEEGRELFNRMIKEKNDEYANGDNIAVVLNEHIIFMHSFEVISKKPDGAPDIIIATSLSDGDYKYLNQEQKKKAPNQAPETTILTVTDRAPSSTLRASEDRVSP